MSLIKEEDRGRKPNQTYLFAFVCLFYFFMFHYFFTTAGRAKTAKQDSNYTHRSEDTNERSMSKNSDK